MDVRAEIAGLLRVGHGIVTIREHPQLARRLQELESLGLLSRPLPGVYLPRSSEHDIDLRIRAAARWQPDGVLTGAAAARLSFWPEVRLAQVTMSHPAKLASQPGYRLTRERLPPELIATADGVRVSVPALTALDLIATRGGAGIDEALRSGACRLEDMHEALRLTPHRQGNRRRRELLHDSRDEPWSEAERLVHALLRIARIRGWRTNHPVILFGRLYFLDVAFPGLRVVIEVDGYEAHSKRPQFHDDRVKWTALTASGWRVVHVTWDQLRDQPGWLIDMLRLTLALAG